MLQIQEFVVAWIKIMGSQAIEYQAETTFSFACVNSTGRESFFLESTVLKVVNKFNKKLSKT